MKTRLMALAAAAGLALSTGSAYAQQPEGRQLAPSVQDHIRQVQAQQHGGPGLRPLPPGFNPRRPAPPAPHGGEHAEAGAAHGGEHHCPGHGPLDRPPHINWWRGLLAVNNELAQSDSALNQLLFRYENEKNPCDPKNMPPPFLASVLNFALLGFILYRFGKKPLAEALVKRKAAIMGDIVTASRLKKEAEARLKEYEDKFENLEETMEQLRAEYAAQAELEKQHILTEAEERRARMRRDAEFRIEQELKAARAELLQQAVEEAVAAAEALVKQRVGQTDQERLADDYLKTVSSSLGGFSSTSASAQGGR